MGEYVTDEEIKKAFLTVWATGLSRRKIAIAFGRTASWVQWMTEITDAPPRRITVHNFKRISGQEPDNRLERRVYYRAANELKLGMVHLKHRVNEVKRLRTERASYQSPLIEAPGFARKRTSLKSGMKMLAKRVAKLRELAPEDPLIAEANSIVAESRALFDSLPFRRKKSPRK